MRLNDGEFRSVVERHQGMVFAIAQRLLADRGAAEEVAQDCFVELYRGLAKIDGEEHLTFWLRRVAVHRATDALRRRRVRPEFAAEAWEDDARAETARDRSAVESRMERLLQSLPEAMRVVVVLRYAEEMRPEEIAALLGQRVATVKSNLQRGMELMRRKADVLLKEYVR